MAACYQEYSPGAALAPFVECLWSVETGAGETDHAVLPDGCADIVFSAHDGLRAVGAMTTARTFALPARARVLGVRFHPGGAGQFLRIAPREIVDRVLPLEEILGKPARRLAQRLVEADATTDALAVLAGALGAPEHGLSPVQRAIAAMVSARGEADMGEMARAANLSPRQFRRRALEETGLTPKHLCRVLRFRRAVELIARARFGWARVAAECGYYDQSHLIHDFREFAGRTPAEMSVFSNPRERLIA